ncbi:Glycosyl hydrolase [Neofusicoccum parvum]|nr:Glycosyl hydrolase [Neofusicoccum parvum]
MLDFAADTAQKPFLQPHEGGYPKDYDAELAAILSPETGGGAHWPLNPLEELHDALETMQSRYFELWLGQWPSAIDWTAAVMATFVSASLLSLTRSLEYVLPGTEHPSVEGQRIENEISKYFSQSVAYYFGEDAFSIRMQAYDDMLWVVLGWLENIKFISLHATRHYRPSGPARAWYGKQFAPAFAHRAHIFYNIASEGWDTELCNGGMTWNPRLTPYKNAITNQLFISASIGMYLYFPGDENTSPFMQAAGGGDGGLPSARPHDRHFLAAAVDGYNWLRSSNMTNSKGLYVDGFHIHNWGKNGSIGTGKCDERNEMTYTYNQGVLLSGLRGLWEGTGEQWYLEDGHELVRNVIAATGWAEHEKRRKGKKHHNNRVDEDRDDVDTDRKKKKKRRQWKGMGRDGILEEVCDASGTCSQNGQTFKGIFFHHLTLFCEPLPLDPMVPGVTYGASRETAALHRQSCKEYAPWVAHNARMALRTRDEHGRFGMWWGAPIFGAENEEMETPPLPLGAVDYRNNDTLPEGRMWMPLKDYDWNTKENDDTPSFMGFDPIAGLFGVKKTWDATSKKGELRAEIRDKNDRGRGRTVETQGGGVAVVRALWEFVNMYRD